MHQKILLCSAAYASYGSPLLSLTLKSARSMFLANTISLLIVLVAGTPILQLATAFIAFVVTLIKFSIFKMLTLLVFLSMLRDTLLFSFVFLL